MSRDTETFLRHCRRMADAARTGAAVKVTAPGQAFSRSPRLVDARVPAEHLDAWEALAQGAADLGDQLDDAALVARLPGPDDVPLL